MSNVQSLEVIQVPWSLKVVKVYWLMNFGDIHYLADLIIIPMSMIPFFPPYSVSFISGAGLGGKDPQFSCCLNLKVFDINLL